MQHDHDKTELQNGGYLERSDYMAGSQSVFLKN